MGAPAPARSIRVEMAGPPPHYVPDKLTARAGTLVFFLMNKSHGVHTLAIGPPSALEGLIPRIEKFVTRSDPLSPGDLPVFTVRGLKAGPYAIWCTIDEHAAEGMVGTLMVK